MLVCLSCPPVLGPVAAFTVPFDLSAPSFTRHLHWAQSVHSDIKACGLQIQCANPVQ